MEHTEGLPHKLTLEERKKLTMTGVTEVEHFEEELARLVTERGTVSIHGRELKLKCLSLDGGQVSVTGEVDAVIYEQAREKGRRRLWRD